MVEMLWSVGAKFESAWYGCSARRGGNFDPIVVIDSLSRSKWCWSVGRVGVFGNPRLTNLKVAWSVNCYKTIRVVPIGQ